MAVIPNPELEWYFCQADADLGVVSSYGAMINRVQVGGAASSGTQDAHWPSERQCAAAIRQTEVRRALRQLEARMQAVLEAAYEPRQYPPQLTSTFGDLVIGVVMRGKSAQRSLEGMPEYRAVQALHALGRLVGSKKRPPPWFVLGGAEDAVAAGDEVHVQALRAATETLLEEAHQAYRDARFGATPRPRSADREIGKLSPTGKRGASKRSLKPAASLPVPVPQPVPVVARVIALPRPLPVPRQVADRTGWLLVEGL